MILPTRFPYLKTTLALGAISLLSFFGINRLSQKLEQSATCVVSGMAAVEGKTTTLSNSLTTVTAPSCGCCSSNSLGAAGATGWGIILLQVLGVGSGIGAVGFAGAGIWSAVRSRRVSAAQPELT